jgi:hypothetical protein
MTERNIQSHHPINTIKAAYSSACVLLINMLNNSWAIQQLLNTVYYFEQRRKINCASEKIAYLYIVFGLN